LVAIAVQWAVVLAALIPPCRWLVVIAERLARSGISAAGLLMRDWLVRHPPCIQPRSAARVVTMAAELRLIPWPFIHSPLRAFQPHLR
jgi:hypothetical protein